MFLAKLFTRSSNGMGPKWSTFSNKWNAMALLASEAKQEKAKIKIGGGGAAARRARKVLRDYEFPEIRSDHCQQQFISGWGPGGQKVNTAQNAVQLKHVPTNVSVKVHESRLLTENVSIAFERLKYAVDKHINKEKSYMEQFETIMKDYEQKMKNQRRKRREDKQNYEID